MTDNTPLDPSCITFYFNDGTKEVVKADTYHEGLNKLQKENYLLYFPFWIRGNGEGADSFDWAEEHGWVLSEAAKKCREQEDLRYKSFDALIFNDFSITNDSSLVSIKPTCMVSDDISMSIETSEGVNIIITKQQAMDFFGLVEPE